MSLDSFSEIFAKLFGGRGGGRRPHLPNQEALDANEDTWLHPCEPHQARLTIVQITDVYTLDNFASLRTMLETMRAARQDNGVGKCDKVISMLTGDFLAPYLLSSIDTGKGMMDALRETPVDYLTWGNHEADIQHKDVCKHVKNYKGTFINSNMQDHDSMKYDCCVPYEVITIQSADGTQTRKIGFIAVLSNDPKLYSHFKEPAFGGATIEDPWETLAKYKKILEEEHGCDLIIPLEHMYVPENTKTCEQFDFPLILSGHDHHRIDQVINNTRLIKPGMDAVHAAAIEIVWDTTEPKTPPRIRSTFVPTAHFDPCPILKVQTDAAYDVLLPLRNTMLAGVLPSFRPLTSKNARGSLCTMGQLVCSMLKQSLIQTHSKQATQESSKKPVEAVILMGGNIRGNEDYPDDSFFSLETLEAEIKSDEVVGFVDMPGHVLAAGIEATHAGEPIPGWFQYDDGIKEENGKVTTVNGKPLEPDKFYRVATKIKDLTNGQSPPLTKFYKENSHLLPAKGQYINIHSELMGFFARGMFRKLWEATGELIPDPTIVAEDESHPVNMERLEGRLRLSVLDRDGDGYLTVDDIHYALRDFLGLSVSNDYKTLAEAVYNLADITASGTVTVEDFELFCLDMPREMRLHKRWEKVFPDPVPDLSSQARNHYATSGSETGSDPSNRADLKMTNTMKRNDTEQTELERFGGDNDLPPATITFQEMTP